MTFQPIDISTLSEIKATFATAEHPETYSTVLLATFRGHASNSHESSFRHIKIMMAGNMVAAVPDAIILDFSNLKYEWGDEMADVLFYCSNHPIEACQRIPVVVITSELNREGLTSLVRDEMRETPDDWLTNSLEDAISTIERLRREIRMSVIVDKNRRWFDQEIS